MEQNVPLAGKFEYEKQDNKVRNKVFDWAKQLQLPQPAQSEANIRQEWAGGLIQIQDYCFFVL